jgi:DNA-binding NarL/FixJ family response regulator
MAQPAYITPGENKIIKAGNYEVSLLDELTERELEVLQEMAKGLRNNEIARNLFVTEGTAKTHVHRILQKLGVDARTQTVILALRHGIIA